VGYSDATTFSRAFQKQYGQTPKSLEVQISHKSLFMYQNACYLVQFADNFH
jgi:AraC-like DNA-binding protein